jgi:hypothetical protein
VCDHFVGNPPRVTSNAGGIFGELSDGDMIAASERHAVEVYLQAGTGKCRDKQFVVF